MCVRACVCVVGKEMLIKSTGPWVQSTSASTSKMPVLSLTSLSSRNVAITFSMSSVVNCKMLFIYFVLILTNCMSWSASGGVGGSVLASSISEPKAKSAFLHAGDIAETHKFSATFNNGADDAPNTTPAATPAPPNAAATSSVSSVKQDFVLHPLGAGGGSGASGGVGATATGSASSRFNVDLRRSSVSSTGAIQSPTTFIGSSGTGGAVSASSGHNHHQIRRKPQQLSSSLSATKSAFDEKSKY